MVGREVSSSEVLYDIRAGMDDGALMEKYKLSSVGLQKLYKKLIEAGLLRQNPDQGVVVVKRRVSARQIIRDIESGMGRGELMEKYRLSSQTLQRLCSKLLNLRAVNKARMIEEITLPDPGMPSQNIVRESQRYYLDFELPVYEVSHPDLLGQITDITEEGVGLIGIGAKVNEIKKFVVLGDIFGEVFPFEFEGICRWFDQESPDGDCAAGFQITSISGDGFQELQKLIRLVTLRA